MDKNWPILLASKNRPTKSLLHSHLSVFTAKTAIVKRATEKRAMEKTATEDWATRKLGNGNIWQRKIRG